MQLLGLRAGGNRRESRRAVVLCAWMVPCAAAAAARAEAEAPAHAEGPPDTSEDNAPVVWKEFKIPEDDTDRIPDWMSDASGTSDVGDDGGSDGSNDGDSDSDSDGG